MSMHKTWIILGASSPIARAFSAVAAAEKCDLILVGRDEQDLQANASDLRTRYQINAHVKVLDLGDTTQHADLIKQCQELAPHGLNVYVAFAMMPSEHDLKNNPSLARDVLTVNAVAPIHFLESFMPVLTAQGQGHIIVMGSVAGDRGRRRNGIYSASKACLNIYTESLRSRLGQDGIIVTLVKPGLVDTRMNFYSDKIPFAAKPEVCAFACWQAAKYRKGTVYFPWFWRVIMFVVKRMPESLLRRLAI